MLFTPIAFREITLKNHIVVSPMCQYSSDDGFASDWHLVHLGSRAVGGASLVFTEATAVTPEGRISPQDLGLWKDAQAEMLARIAKFVRAQGAADRWRPAPGCLSRRSARCVRAGPSGCRYSFAFRRPTGWTAAGPPRTPSGSHEG